MKTILVPLDGSTLAEQVLPSVRMLAPILGARVQLLHIISEADRYHFLADDESIGEAGGVPAAQSAHTGSWEPLRQNAEDYLKAQAAALSAAGVEAGVSVLL